MGNNRAKKRAKQGKRIRPDGSIWYYYHKRKMGHPKKRGPKKKKPIKEPKVRTWAPWNFKIIRCDWNKHKKYIGRFHTLEDVYTKKEELELINSQVVFPKETISSFKNSPKTYPQKSEYLILQKKENDATAPQLRNEYGKIVEHKLNVNDWMIIDKFPCVEEETFWVYGFDNKKDRKTFMWILDNLILSHIHSQLDYINIYLYNNKPIFRYDNKEINFVICKDVSDAIRMYNLLSEKLKKNKQVIFTGITNGYYERGKEVIKMLKEKTGWTDKDIWRRSTRH